jgi:hypothetical protein
MADLFVHFAVGYSTGKFIKDRKVRVLYYAGNFIPDVVFKAFLYLTGSPTWYCEPSHSPLILLVICYFFALLFDERIRLQAFLAFFVGSLLHLVIDSFKNHMGKGIIMYGFPFTMERIGFGLYYIHQSAYLILPAIILILLSTGIEHLVKVARHRFTN